MSFYSKGFPSIGVDSGVLLVLALVSVWCWCSYVVVLYVVLCFVCLSKLFMCVYVFICVVSIVNTKT